VGLKASFHKRTASENRPVAKIADTAPKGVGKLKFAALGENLLNLFGTKSSSAPVAVLAGLVRLARLE
jgi:hypothetical protein